MVSRCYEQFLNHFISFSLNWFTLSIVFLCRIYQVANVKSEWNVIKTFPDLSGTGSVLFFFLARLFIYSPTSRFKVHVCTVSKMLLELNLSREGHMCKIWRRFKIFGGWINGQESSNIWPAWRRYSCRIIKYLSCIVLGYRVTVAAYYCLISLVGKVNESFDLLWLFSLGSIQSHTIVYVCGDGAIEQYARGSCSNISKPCLVSTDLKNRLVVFILSSKSEACIVSR